AALPQPAAMPVAPMADAQRQMLDMGRQDWPQKMIDHIEALRDNANANDTSIRLKPEALGRVDIALKTHDDGAISVRFTAEQPATRTLLVDATPQLSAAAEARGIRLSGTSVDLSGQGDQRPQPQSNQAPDRARPAANRLAPSRGDDNQTVDDGRIA
ncbi:MAG: flagellar hook-length control protein FliK, partial [Proteobacteria bacterium]|nr:flagellar hook-length control protein FliK [Pseudomonadota bacterium]